MMLLQAGGEIFRQGGNPNPSLVTGFIVAVGAIALLVVAGTIVSRRSQPRSAEDIARYSAGVFRRAGKGLGLTGPQVDLLESLVRLCKVRQPLLVFTNAGLLDDTLRKGLYSIDNARDLSPEEKENRRALVFQVKQVIESNARKGAMLRSTTFLKPGQPLSVTPEGEPAFASRVISNMKDFLTVAAPGAAPARGSSRWMRGTRLSVYLWRENDAGYSFASKVLGYDTVKGVPSMLIQHSKTLRREQRRRARRRELLRPCFFYPVRIVESGEGRKAERKAAVEQSHRTLGTVVDLSAGGCAVQTLNPFEKGKLIMLEFEIAKGQPVRAFGKVVQISRRMGKGGAMNVRFTRVTSQYLNRISEFVYDFTRPTTVAQAREQLGRSAGLPPRAR